MNLRRVGLGACLLLALAGGATSAQVTIPDRFDLRQIDAPDAAAGMARCLGQSGTEAAAAFIRDTVTAPAPDQGRQFSPDGAAGVVLAVNGYWTCVSLSPTRFPIWPLESMTETISATSIAPQSLADWHRALLERLAERGQASGLLVYANGNGIQFDFSAQPQKALYLTYQNKFLKADAVDEAGMHAVLRDPALAGLRIVNPLDPKSPNHPGQPAIPTSRVMWPVEDGRVKAPPGEMNDQLVLEGTQWGSEQGTRIWLQPNGVMVMSTPHSTSNGSWQAQEGVVYMSLGSTMRYALRVSPDGKSLAGRALRTPPAAAASARPTARDVDSGPRQWTMKMTLQR